MQKTSTGGFVLHAVIALVSLLILNWLIPLKTPLFIKEIQYSYWIFFYHFPAAINCYIFFLAVALCSVLYLATGDPIWDQRARAAGEVGLLACTITISTGSTWARMAWNQWWIWDDARLISAAVMWLIYVGYVMMQMQLEPSEQKRRWAAVLGILAVINVPVPS